MEKYYRKKDSIIQQISKQEKKYGLSKGYIRRPPTRTTNSKIYVEDIAAMKIWEDFKINPEKVKQIKNDIKERKQMSNE